MQDVVQYTARAAARELRTARLVERMTLVSIAVTLPIGVAEFYFGRLEERREQPFQFSSARI